MKIFIAEGNEVCRFTYEEEQALADMVMTIISNRGAKGKVKDIACDLYFYGTNGLVIRKTTIDEFVDHTINLVKRYDAHGIEPPAPMTIFIPVEDNEHHQQPEVEMADGEEFGEWFVEEQQMAWREVWVNYRTALSKIDDKYRVFPGDVDGQSEENRRTLIKFFQSAIQQMEDYKMNLHQVLPSVMDTANHLGLTKDELWLAKDEYWDEAQRWHNTWKQNRKDKRDNMTDEEKKAETINRWINNLNLKSIKVCDGGSARKAPPVKSRLSDVEARQAYDKELADYNEYMNRGKK